MRHTAEHVLSQALQSLYGKDSFYMAMGPAIADGFYMDFDPKDLKFSEEEFPKIEAEMKKIIAANLPVVRKEISLQEAKELFSANPYKAEWLSEIENAGEKLTAYYTGDQFLDLCKGPHVANTSEVKAFKLLNVAGAYWHGDEKQKMLTRIYGTAFNSQEELEHSIWQKEEAKKRDHRKLGKELDLFLFSELVGGGLPLWTPRGTILRNELNDFVWELRKAKGYERVSIPHITKKDLYVTSGHWDKFSNELFKIMSREGTEFAMKPMNCPHHTQIFAHLQRSYKEMPQRYAETTMVYRDEQSGELSGLSRVRCITQDDAHVFCRQSQIKQEFFAIWDIVNSFYGVFNFDLRVRLSFHDPEKFEAYLGTKETWAKAEAALIEIAKERNANYFIAPGEAAMYGPKMDFISKDSLGRDLQVATIQLDMNLPERFDLFCINEEGKQERIVMLHAAIMGSIERFSSVMIEHFAGAFPAWLAPEQVRIIPISDQNLEYANKLKAELDALDIRSYVDSASERMQNKVRQAQELKVPYMLIVGKNEEANNTVSLRYRTNEEIRGVNFVDFTTKLSENIKNRTLDIKLM
jgi:threonyl-tRNA synthetase